MAATYYTLDGGAETTGTVVTVSTVGPHTLEFWSVDLAGNIETPRNTWTFGVTDTIAPTTISHASASYAGAATINLTATDTAGGSGVADTYYTVDGGAETTGTVVTVSTYGSHTLEFWSRDVAGNVETPRKTAEFTVADTIAPTTAVSCVPGGDGRYASPIYLTPTDNAGGSGVAVTYYRLDGGAQTTYNSPTGIVVAGGPGQLHTLEFWSVDVAGNVETPPKTLVDFEVN